MNTRWNASAIAKLGLLTAVALVLGYVEHLLPITGIPGVKLGLANTVLLYALYLLDIPSAILLMILKVGLSGLLFGGVAAMLYSFAGGVVSLLVMILARRMKGISVNKLFDEWTAQMLTEMDVERRFRLMATQGNTQAALRILEKIDASNPSL